MNDKRLMAVLLAVASVSISPIAIAMSITELEVPSTVVYGMSGDGTKVVGSSFLWTSSGAVQDLDFYNTSPSCISGDATVVAGNEYYSIGGNGTAFYQYLSEDGEHQLDGWYSSYFSDANAINADGSVIVGWIQNGYEWTDKRIAARWEGNMEMGYTNRLTFGTLPGGYGYDHSAEGVSADGSVVVGKGRSTNGNEAFLWTQSSGITGLGDLAGGAFNSTATGISDDGLVVIGNSTSGNGYEAFRWTQAGGMIGLGDLAGGDFFSLAYAISDDGSVIIGSSKSGAGTEPFVWDAVNGMRPLKTILVDGGIDLTGWTLGSVKDISDDGTKVLGSGVNPGGTNRLFIADLTTLPGEIGVTGAGGPISDNGTANFGNHAVGMNKVRTFRISNDATGDATSLSDFSITKDGADAAAFTVGAISAGNLGNGQSTTFRVTFTPTSASAHSAAIHILSNDEDESPFDINLSGVGLANSDSEPGSDAWETANGFAPNIYDFYTLDSDGDGISDIREIYFGWSRFPSFPLRSLAVGSAMEEPQEGSDFFNVHTTSNGILKVQYRRSTTQTALIAQPIWTSNLSSTNGWKYSDESELGAVITVSEIVVSNGVDFEIVEASAEPVSGSSGSLFFTLELSPNE